MPEEARQSILAFNNYWEDHPSARKGQLAHAAISIVTIFALAILGLCYHYGCDQSLCGYVSLGFAGVCGVSGIVAVVLDVDSRLRQATSISTISMIVLAILFGLAANNIISFEIPFYLTLPALIPIVYHIGKMGDAIRPSLSDIFCCRA